mgnify:CR=1 FL=1
MDNAKKFASTALTVITVLGLTFAALMLTRDARAADKGGITPDVLKAQALPAPVIEAPDLGTFYIGGSLGSSFADLNALSEDGAELAYNVTILAGYQKQFANYMFGGVEVDLTYDDVRIAVTDGTTTVTKKPGFTGSARLIGGVSVTDRLNLFVTGGAAFTEDLDLGLALGAGMDVEISRNLSLRGEVRYTDFDLSIGGTSLDYNDTSARVGLIFRLN